MPLPLILGIGAVIAGAVGVAGAASGVSEMNEAKESMEKTKRRHEENIDRLKREEGYTTSKMDSLGSTEVEILKSFETFSDLIEKIQNRPEFEEQQIRGVKLPRYTPNELREVSIGAGVLLGSLGGAAAGTAGGIAAAGAATTAVMALGTASTGTAIASLSGAAATNATLAALGGGALAAGGGGVALGSAILGGATLGIGLLVGGLIFGAAGSKLSDQADEARSQMLRAEEKIDKICSYLKDLYWTADRFLNKLTEVKEKYDEHLERLSTIIDQNGKRDWNWFTEEEKLVTQNTVLLVSILYKMCKVQLVLKSESDNDTNKINTQEIDSAMETAESALEEIG